MPPYVDTLQYLFRADVGTYQDLAGSTPATADGASVALWKDQAGNANHLGASTPPILKLAQINGLSSIQFNGSSQLFQFSNQFISLNRTIYAVVKSASAGVSTMVCGDYHSLEFRLDNLQPRLVDALVADIGFATTALSSGAWTQLNVSWDGTTGIFRQASAANGTVTGSGGVAPTEYVGANGNQSSPINFFSGHVALVMEYVGVHTTMQRQAVEAWINSIWGV